MSTRISDWSYSFTAGPCQKGSPGSCSKFGTGSLQYECLQLPAQILQLLNLSFAEKRKRRHGWIPGREAGQGHVFAAYDYEGMIVCGTGIFYLSLPSDSGHLQFMQRAAASSAATDSSAAEQPSPKRRRLSSNASPSAGNSDLQAIQAALAAEEAKRQQALERQSAEAGETRWMLSFQDAADSSDGRQDQSGLQVISTGYAGIDESVGKHRNDLGSDDESWTNPTVGRRVFGKFKRAQEVSTYMLEDRRSKVSLS